MKKILALTLFLVGLCIGNQPLFSSSTEKSSKFREICQRIEAGTINPDELWSQLHRPTKTKFIDREHDGKNLVEIAEENKRTKLIPLLKQTETFYDYCDALSRDTFNATEFAAFLKEVPSPSTRLALVAQAAGKTSREHQNYKDLMNTYFQGLSQEEKNAAAHEILLRAPNTFLVKAGILGFLFENHAFTPRDTLIVELLKKSMGTLPLIDHLLEKGVLVQYI